MLKKFIALGTAFLTFASTTAAFATQINMPLNYDRKTEVYNNEEIKISVDGQYITNFNIPPLSIEGRTLVPARDVFEFMGANVLWNEDLSTVNISLNSDLITLKINDSQGIKNDTVFNMEVPAKIINDRTMIPLRAVSEALGYDVNWNDDKREASIYINNAPVFGAGVIGSDTPIEIIQPDSSLEQTETVKPEETNTEAVPPNVPLEEPKTEVPPIQQSGKLSMVWDQISKAEQNTREEKKVAINGLDVIMPTWFELSDGSGNILDKGDIEYAQWAKNQGYKLWALFSNSFDSKITHEALSNETAVNAIIADICQKVDKYGLDGVNIDFENVAAADGEYYVNFVKKITEALKAKNIVVSVDMYVPKPWTKHYNMEEIGKTVDYVMIMAYDEHWSTSPESGSVASINWVDEAMAEATKYVDSAKLIMGLPFYTRRWAEEPNGNVTSVSMKMQEAYDMLVQMGAQIVWDESCGQYYGEWEIDGVVRKIWLEDEKSIEEKMKIVNKYNLAGIAAWKRGHEKPEVWNVINTYLGKQ